MPFSFSNNRPKNTKENEALGMLSEWGSRYEILHKKHIEEHKRQDINGAAQGELKKFGYRINAVIADAAQGDRYTVYAASTADGRRAIAKVCPKTSPLIKFFMNEVRVHTAVEKIIRDFEFETHPFAVPNIIQFIDASMLVIFITQFLPNTESSLEDRVKLSSDLIRFSRLAGELLILSRLTINKKTLTQHYELISYYISMLRAQNIEFAPGELLTVQRLFSSAKIFFDFYNKELIHGDLHTEHLIRHNEKIYLVDWEHGRLGNITENAAALHNMAFLTHQDIPVNKYPIQKSHWENMLNVMRVKQALRGMFFSKICRDDPAMFLNYQKLFKSLVS